MTPADARAVQAHGAGRAARLLKEMEEDKLASRHHAKRLELQVAACWWWSVLLAGAAGLLGLLSAVPEIQGRLAVQPWWISLLTVASGAAVVIRRKTAWRVKSDIFYGRERDIRVLIARWRYELPEDVSDQQIAEISRAFETAKDRFGKRMNEINRLVDEPEK